MKFKSLIYSTIAAGFMLTATTSCNRFLDTEPISDRIINDTAPITTAAQAEQYMNTIYANFGNEYWQLDYLLNGDAQTDISYAGADNVQVFQIDEYRILSTNSVVARDWRYLNNFVDHSNRILNYVDDVQDASLTTARKNEMKAEASIFRAMYVFHMTQLWGETPLVTKFYSTINESNFNEAYTQLYPKRQNVETVYQQIISDLEGAIPYAPASTHKTRANKAAAYALLAKVYATKPNPDWAKVKEYCDRVTAEGHTLLPTYDHLFDNQHLANAESIWEVQGNAGSIWAWGTDMFKGTNWKKFNTPSNDLVKAFNDAGDTQRLSSSVDFPTTKVGWTDNFWPTDPAGEYPFMNKWRINNGRQGFYILRYADILLLKAEALVRTGDYVTAAGLVNQVRNRVGLANITISSENDGIDKILAERKLKLAFEGHRWFDLKRTGKAIEILSKQKDGNGNVIAYTQNLTQDRLLWPVPQQQMDKNKNLIQNPGY